MSSVQADVKCPHPADNPSVAEATVKRRLSPHEQRPFKSQRSISDDLAPVMSDVCLAGNNGEAMSEPRKDTNSNGVANPDSEPALAAQADALMHDDDGELTLREESHGIDEHDGGKPEPTNGAKHVKELVQEFESGTKTEYPAEERISPSTAHDEESFSGHGFPGQRVIAKTVKHVKAAVKDVGHTVVDAVSDGAQDILHDVKQVARSFRFLLPKSSLEEEDPNNNVHVPNPDAIGQMIGLGMNIHKVNKGHLIKSVTTGGLAEKAKLQNNDIITFVNDEDISNWAFEELQQFFGNLKSVEIKLVIARQDGVDEKGEPIYKTVTITIKLSLEGDKVVVEIETDVGMYQLAYGGGAVNNLPVYYIVNSGVNTSKYLSMDDKEVVMTTDFQAKCRFKTYTYQPTYEGPIVFVNVSQNKPIDLGKDNRIGINSTDLTNGSYLTVDDDKRFFFVERLSGHVYVFPMVSRPTYYLTVGDDDKLGVTHYGKSNLVANHGKFDMLLEDKLGLQKQQSRNPKYKPGEKPNARK